MVIDIRDLVRNKDRKTKKETSNNSINKYSYSLLEELSNFYMLSQSQFSEQELGTFEYVIGELVKVNLLAEQQLRQSLPLNEIGASFLYYVDNDFHEFHSSESFINYLYNESKFARSLMDAFQDNKKMRDVILHFMDTAQKRLAEYA